MRSIQTLTVGVLAEIVRRQQASPARTAFAWQLVVGPTLARLTSVQLEGTELIVRASDPRWLKEIDRARTTILPRLQALLGTDAITRLTTQ
jgi:Dna[CI] antecedent DciA-like protein